jgi:hypothetical protein
MWQVEKNKEERKSKQMLKTLGNSKTERKAWKKKNGQDFLQKPKKKLLC